MGTASCAIWKSLRKHEREEKDQELGDLNPTRSPKPPNHFCHFCFLFSKQLGCACIIFLNFPPNLKGEKYPFSEIGCFVGSGTSMCSPVALSQSPRASHPPPFCRWQLTGGCGLPTPAATMPPRWPCNTRALSSGHRAGFPPPSQPPIFSRLVRM